MRQYCPGGTDIISNDPYLFSCSNFLTQYEIDHILRKAIARGFERSLTYGSQKPDERRTSEQIFLSRREDESDPVLHRIESRVSAMMGYPRKNFEHMQVLKYNGTGKLYKKHHDLIADHREKAHGFRVATFFIYLSDNFNGGETEFPYIGRKIAPRKGRAIFWYNLMPHYKRKDPRTNHGALSLTNAQDIKYSVNLWIHSGSYRRRT